MNDLSDNAQAEAAQANALVEQFASQGFVLLRSVLDAAHCEALRLFIQQSLQPLVGPAEFEADVGYPGAPADRRAAGGQTPRRLLHAYARSDLLRDTATHPRLARVLRLLLADDDVLMSQCHHNCVMTKHPGYSSATLWHQDIRYWSYDKPELVSAWFALGSETRKNGALRVIPGSHKLHLDRGRLDRDLFLRPELDVNRDLIHQAQTVELEAGDVLLFHCQLFHAAGKNLSEHVKLSPVFTYHKSDNHPIPGTRSARFP
ncbi:MAG: phytanoyl-CoA dioxygenase family protein, partial [Pseudomonadota bacterium]